MIYILSVIIFILGLCVGSFLNVVIYRIPNSMSLISPSSHCPKCNNKIKWYDNIPLISFILLKGRCRHCKEKISIIYPLVELFTGIMYLTIFIVFRLSFDTLFNILFFSVLFPLAVIDEKTTYIPLSFNVFIIVLSAIKIILFSFTKESFPYFDFLMGGFVGGGLFLLIYLISRLIMKKEALGTGDIILFFGIGLFLDFKNVLLVILFSSTLCSIVELILIKIGIRKKDSEIPYGPYIVLSALLVMFIGPYILSLFSL